MTRAAAAIFASSKAAAERLAPRARPHSGLLHLLFSLGLFGLFFVAIVDSSFVPLPLPGITDIMLIVLAARHGNIVLLLIASSAGSLIGGYLSYRAGYRGGVALLEKHAPRISKLVHGWMDRHAILAVALPAILPPPMPLSPFVLAAGALRMSRKKFLTTFSISRGLRHALAIWLGVRYGPHILRLWNRLSAQYATPVAIVLWTTILSIAAIAFWKLYKNSRSAAPKDITGHTSTTA